jgi:hypothetical protein
MRAEREILADVKRLAIEYYELTGKPLGVTGEIAEYEAATKLNLTLAAARTVGFDALASDGRRVQIKGRRLPSIPAPPGQRMGKVDLSREFDTVMLVILDPQFEAYEIWEAERATVARQLRIPGSRARNDRGQLPVAQFKRVAQLVWARTARTQTPDSPS